MAVAEVEWGRAVEALRSARDVALGCHVDPDGDALGSMLALRQLLVRRSLPVWAGWAAENAAEDEPLRVPPAYRDLPWVDQVVPRGAFPAAPDVFVALDCASPGRLGGLRAVARAARVVVVVDHHAAGEPFGDVRLIDPGAPATAALVVELADRLGEPIDAEQAACLYAGLVTDTGRFSYASATPETLRLGARLMETGIDHAAINRRVWDTHRLGYLRVLGHALGRVTLLAEDDLVYTVVTCADVDGAGITLPETEGIIDVVRGIEDAECALVLKEQPDGSYKASLRSKSRVDVGRVAERLGGGGHRFAAGFTSDREPEAIVAGVVDALRAVRVQLAEG